MSPTTPPITVSIPSTIYCSGSHIEGDVILDFRQVQQEKIEEVHVKLRGFIHTVITRDRTTLRESYPLIYSNLSLWSRGTVYPAPGSDTLHLPFRFLLPDNLPPSFQYHGFQKSASVLYALTAVGTRPGTFQFNRRLRTPIVVLPKDELGVQLRTTPASGWRTVKVEEKMRRGLWGEYATAQIEFSLPDIPVLPLFSEIPCTINVMTTTAPLTAVKANALPAGKPIFPSPPTKHTDIDLRLIRRVAVRAKHFATMADADIAYLLGEGTAPGKTRVDVEIQEKVWIPMERNNVNAKWTSGNDKKDGGGGDEEEKGSWIQRASYESKMLLKVPPTFSTNLVSCEYIMRLKVPFAGIGNDVLLLLPVRITSAINAPVPRQAPSSAEDETDGPPPPMLDLPPAYWDVNGRDWHNMDEKD